MAKDFSRQFYRSKQWQACRTAYIQNRIMIDGGMCERCHDNLGYILHHKVHLNALNINNPDVTLNHCNLEYVCKLCHDKEHFQDIHKTVKPNAIFQESGQPVDVRKI